MTGASPVTAVCRIDGGHEADSIAFRVDSGVWTPPITRPAGTYLVRLLLPSGEMRSQIATVVDDVEQVVEYHLDDDSAMFAAPSAGAPARELRIIVRPSMSQPDHDAPPFPKIVETRSAAGVSVLSVNTPRVRYVAEIVGPSVPRRTIQLPASSSSSIAIYSTAADRDSFHGGAQVHVAGADTLANAVFGYLDTGQYDAAATLGGDLVESAISSGVYAPTEERITAAGYYQLRTGTYDALLRWAGDFARTYGTTDANIIYAWSLIGTGDKDSRNLIRSLLTGAADRGLPSYTIGVKLLHEGLRIALSHTDPGDDTFIRNRLDRVSRLLGRCDRSARHTTLRTTDDTAPPSRAPVWSADTGPEAWTPIRIVGPAARRSAPAKFNTAFHYVNSKGVTYFLHRTTVTLRGGRPQTIYFFSKTEMNEKGEPTDIPADREVSENPRSGLVTLTKKRGASIQRRDSGLWTTSGLGTLAVEIGQGDPRAVMLQTEAVVEVAKKGAGPSALDAISEAAPQTLEDVYRDLRKARPPYSTQQLEDEPWLLLSSRAVEDIPISLGVGLTWSRDARLPRMCLRQTWPSLGGHGARGPRVDSRDAPLEELVDVYRDVLNSSEVHDLAIKMDPDGNPLNAKIYCHVHEIVSNSSLQSIDAESLSDIESYAALLYAAV
jgi:hypothetical protein